MPPRLVNIPPVTRILLITLVFQSLLSAVVRYRQWTSSADVIVVPYLTLIPSMSLIYPWTFLTTTFIENNIFTFGISGVAIWHGGKYLERAWTSKEFAKFVVIVALLPNVLTFVAHITLYALTGNLSWSQATISGTTPLQSALLLAFSSLLPAHTVALFRGIVSLRMPRFPLLHLIMVFILTLTPLYTPAHLLLAFYGSIVSWTYLRFYKCQFPDLDRQQEGLRGDRAETFAFAEFFPEPLRPAVTMLSNSVFNVLVSIGLCTPWDPSQVQAAQNASILGGRSGASSSRAETERRRALALKALDQRLQAATAKAPQPPATVQSDITQQPKPQQAAMTAPSMEDSNGKGSTQA